MHNSESPKFAPVINKDKKIEVSIDNGRAVMKLSTWTENLGWCVQKTMTVDAVMLDQLLSLLAAAQMSIESDVSSDDILSASILEYTVTA